jgi:hypothetical protein
MSTISDQYTELTFTSFRSTFINTALILWAYKVSEDPSAPIDTLAFTESANAHPLPFKVNIEPRISGGFDAVREAMEEYGM